MISLILPHRRTENKDDKTAKASCLLQRHGRPDRGMDIGNLLLTQEKLTEQFVRKHPEKPESIDI